MARARRRARAWTAPPGKFLANVPEVTDEIRQTVSSCDDLATLERWHRQAITATDAEDALT